MVDSLETVLSELVGDVVTPTGVSHLSEHIAERLAAAGWHLARPDSLDAAWAEVEAALSEGWWIARMELSGMTTEDMGGNRDRLTWWEAWARGPKDKDAKGVADTPAAALPAPPAELRGGGEAAGGGMRGGACMMPYNARNRDASSVGT